MRLTPPCLLPYFTAGWPDPEAFVESVVGAAAAGCPAFEVGIPFSDPVADGPVIQKTSSAALQAGVNWRVALELTALATQKSGLPAIASVSEVRQTAVDNAARAAKVPDNRCARGVIERLLPAGSANVR